MKPGARRVTLAAAVLGVGIVGVLVVLNWAWISAHLEAWHFELTKETKTIDSEEDAQQLSALWLGEEGWHVHDLERWLQALAGQSGIPVVYEPDPSVEPIPSGTTPAQALGRMGYRILEQRFPRRAYVVIRDESIDEAIRVRTELSRP